MDIRHYEAAPKEYERLLVSAPQAMFFHSVRYHDHLGSALGLDIEYLIASSDTGPLGAIPYSIVTHPKHGPVLNSLPFYGSHGGVLLESSLSEERGSVVRRRLLEAILAHAEETGCHHSTVIRPLFGDDEQYRTTLDPTYIDRRIGQIKELPDSSDRETLLYDVEKRCRTAVRKARKEGIEVTDETENPAAVERLVSEHQAHMESIGGTPKPPEFFEHLDRFHEPRAEYRLLVARIDGAVAGLVLLFYFDDTVEYFTPVTIPEHRSLYPMNLLIFEGMISAIEQGYRWWNFGGTRTTQDGVYRFKKSFNPKNVQYQYYVNRHRASDIKSLSPTEITDRYQWFYVLPFEHLE